MSTDANIRSHKGPLTAIQDVPFVARQRIDAALALVADMPPSDVCDIERRQGELDVALAARRFGLPDGWTVAPSTPATMLSMLTRAVPEGGLPGRNVKRMMRICEIAHDEGWPEIGPVEIQAGTSHSYTRWRRRLGRHAQETIRKLGSMLTMLSERELAMLDAAAAFLLRYPPDLKHRSGCADGLFQFAAERRSCWPDMERLLEEHPEIAPPGSSGRQMEYLSRLNKLSRKLGIDWRDRVWDIVKDDRELAAVFALILTFGSRPKELSMKDGKGGVTVSITPQGALRMVSECAKVKRSPFAWLDKGQEHRWATFAVNGQRQIDFLSDIVKRGGGELILGYLGKHGARDRAAIAAHLSRVVRKVFSTAFPTLDPASTYIGREIWSAELKTQASKLPEEDRATFVCHGMGHIGGRSPQAYAISRMCGGSRGPTILATGAPRKIRNVKIPSPPSRSRFSGSAVRP